MAIYIICSRVSTEAFREPKEFKKLTDGVAAILQRECPAVTWKNAYRTLGRLDVVNIVESDDLKQVERAIMIIRSYGHATTETLVATPWEEFLTNSMFY